MITSSIFHSGRAAARAAVHVVRKFGVRLALAAVIAAAAFTASPTFNDVAASPQGTESGSITGLVRSSQGAEAGVWVIAETRELPTNFIKIVVTNDQGAFTLPDLPKAEYSVWVRGYGLVDSPKTQLKPGAAAVTLQVPVARTEQEKARIYPGNYWMSMMEPPAPSKFPLAELATQDNWMHTFKSSCNFCHQLGNGITRSLDHVLKAMPDLKTPQQAWDYRLRGGVRGVQMNAAAVLLHRDTTINMLVDWTDRIARGETPAEAPARPSGLERNLVLTLWDWGTDHSFMHDENSTSKNKPTVNANGPVYAVSAGHGSLVVLDPKTNRTKEIDIPTRDPRAEVPSRFPAPSPDSLWWGKEHLWSNPPNNPADPHNPMIDNQGRVWLTSRIRNTSPAWCSDPAASKYAAYTPLKGGGRQASYFDPKTNQFTLIETCASTHHLQFDTNAEETVYFNELTGPIFSWVDTKTHDKVMAETKDPLKAERAAVGWCPQVLDTNGDGKITRPWNIAPRLPDNAGYAGDTAGGLTSGRAAATAIDPKRDTLVAFYLYAIIPSPADHSVWGAAEVFPGYIVRLDRGNNAPETCKVEIYKVPAPGLDPRGIDDDRNGVVWTALAASSHLASFDRRKCKNLKGPASLDGTSCPEGWTLYQTTGPKFKGTKIPTDFHYYNWVDQYDVMKFGAGTPMATGSNSDSLLVLNPKNGQWTTLRVPYPLGFYSRGMDARIDDGADWKGRALWANYGTHFVWHIEGGKGTKGKVVKFQIRPDPLAR
jgi:hypothetical protein